MKLYAIINNRGQPVAAARFKASTQPRGPIAYGTRDLDGNFVEMGRGRVVAPSTLDRDIRMIWEVYYTRRKVAVKEIADE